MRPVTKILAHGAAVAMLGAAVPAAAQYYPGYPNYPYTYPQGAPGVPGYGYAPYGGYDQQALTSICSNAVQARLGGYGYGYGYGSGYGGGQVLGVSRIEPRPNGMGMTVRGVARSGYNYGGGPDLVWSCRTDYRGIVVDVDIRRAVSNYNQQVPWGSDESPYGYYRY